MLPSDDFSVVSATYHNDLARAKTKFHFARVCAPETIAFTNKENLELLRHSRRRAAALFLLQLPQRRKLALANASASRVVANPTNGTPK
jgi:hypothetical protein